MQWSPPYPLCQDSALLVGMSREYFVTDCVVMPLTAGAAGNGSRIRMIWQH